ncbi:MAG TPA: hypothetical protein VMR52_13810 [Dehalococcoidia bacterium]|nr:hypothetical protein [Dehalococcoidia bacterium]
MNQKQGAFASAAVVAGLIVAILAALSAGTAPTSAQEDDAPVLTFSNPAQGVTIREPAFFIQMCFEEPVNILDLDKGGDFHFSLTPPETFPLGLRIVFQPDGQGLAIYANNADADVTEGEWNLEYRLTAPETLTPLEGTLTWTVDPDGEEVPQATPPPCIEGGFTATPGAGDGPTPPPVITTPTPDGDDTPSVTSGSGEGEDDDDDDPDILLLALLTISAAAAVGVIALIAFFVRRGVGFEPHRPGPDDEPPHH